MISKRRSLTFHSHIFLIVAKLVYQSVTLHKRMYYSESFVPIFIPGLFDRKCSFLLPCHINGIPSGLFRPLQWKSRWVFPT